MAVHYFVGVSVCVCEWQARQIVQFALITKGNTSLLMTSNYLFWHQSTNTSVIVRMGRVHPQFLFMLWLIKVSLVSSHLCLKTRKLIFKWRWLYKGKAVFFWWVYFMSSCTLWFWWSEKDSKRHLCDHGHHKLRNKTRSTVRRDSRAAGIQGVVTCEEEQHVHSCTQLACC